MTNFPFFTFIIQQIFWLLYYYATSSTNSHRLTPVRIPLALDRCANGKAVGKRIEGFMPQSLVDVERALWRIECIFSPTAGHGE